MITPQDMKAGIQEMIALLNDPDRWTWRDPNIPSRKFLSGTMSQVVPRFLWVEIYNLLDEVLERRGAPWASWPECEHYLSNYETQRLLRDGLSLLETRQWNTTHPRDR